MIVNFRKQYAVKSILIFFGLLLVVAVRASANETDPTTPSLPISQLLALGSADSQKATTGMDAKSKEIEPRKLRLKGIVYRDHNNATALISFGNSELYVMQLRRSELQSSLSQMDIGGMRFTVKDFSDCSVLVQNLDTNQQTNIR